MKATMINNIDWLFWRIIIPTTYIASFALPSIDIIIKASLPIISGFVWVFLKPLVEKLRRKIVKKIKTKK